MMHSDVFFDDKAKSKFYIDAVELSRNSLHRENSHSVMEPLKYNKVITTFSHESTWNLLHFLLDH